MFNKALQFFVFPKILNIIYFARKEKIECEKLELSIQIGVKGKLKDILMTILLGCFRHNCTRAVFLNSVFSKIFLELMTILFFKC